MPRFGACGVVRGTIVMQFGTGQTLKASARRADQVSERPKQPVAECAARAAICNVWKVRLGVEPNRLIAAVVASEVTFAYKM